MRSMFISRSAVARVGPIVLVAAAALIACQPPPPLHGPARVPSAGEGRDSIGSASLDATHGTARAEELLEGRFPGVTIQRLANGGISVQIRGASTVLGSSEPLYIVDGTPIEPGPGGALTGINPEDIASIKVLKDIGSTSFYGVRGANGVVLITTKR